jgi:hypothetical protein
MPAEVFGIADAGELQDMRRADRASRQDYLTLGFDALHAAVARILDSDRSHAIEPDAMHQRTGDDLKVGPLHHWAQIAACRTGAPPATSRLLHPADAVARAWGQVVDVLAVFEPQLSARFDRPCDVNSGPPLPSTESSLPSQFSALRKNGNTSSHDQPRLPSCAPNSRSPRADRGHRSCR